MTNAHTDLVTHGAQPISRPSMVTSENSGSRGGFFNNAHHFTIYQPTMIDGTSADDRSSIELLLKNVIPGTEFDALERYPPPSCHPETRLDISSHIQSWIHDSSHERRLLWLHGPAGVGKSAIIQTLAESEAGSSKSILGATLFISRRHRRNDPHRVFITIAYQLAVKYPSYRKYLTDKLSNDPRVVGKSLTEQFRWFFIRPFVQEGVLGVTHEPILILLDGLDECQGDATQRELVMLIGRFVVHNPAIPLIWIIASRPEPHIQKAFSHPHVQNSHLDVAVPINSNQACADVERYLRDKFDDIRQEYAHCFSPTAAMWPTESDFLQIAASARGLFVFASTVIRFIEDEDFGNPVHRLQMILRAIRAVPLSENHCNPFAALDSLYAEIVSSIPQQVLPITRDLLNFALVRYAPFGVASNWLGLTQADAYSALRKLQSVLNVPLPEAVPCGGRLEVFHTSFLDYLLSPARSGNISINDGDSWKALFRAMARVLLQSYNSVDSSVDISRIEISWPYREHLPDVQKEMFEVSLRWFLQFCSEPHDMEHYVCQELAGFFDDLDYGALGALLPRVSDPGRLCFVLSSSSIYRVLEDRNVIRKTTAQSLDLNRLRSTDLASCHMLRRYECDTTALVLAPSFLLEGFEEMAGPTSGDPYWKTRILQHLFVIMNVHPSPDAFLIGKGDKSCVLIMETRDDYLWHYLLPYDQS